ncbi:hypothetical protein VTN02DRAFT_216 [Thermoascus thermophilus]
MGKRKRPAKDDGDDPGEPPHQPPATHPVIALYYPRVVPLRQYLLDQLSSSSSSSSKSRRRRIAAVGGQGEQLADLLDSTLVGVRNESNDPAVDQARQKELAAFTASSVRSSLSSTETAPTGSQAEIVDLVISTLLRDGGSRHKPRHLLAHGFHRGTSGLEERYPNQHAQALRQAPWTDVLALLGARGEDIMMRLLFDCGLFRCVDRRRGVFRQISGVPLLDLEPLAPPKPKDMVLRTPNSIVFVRRRMLYARPALNTNGQVRWGLRHIHALNRFPSPSPEHTVHVMKYIFPRQFGLHNVFTSPVDPRETAQPLKDYTVREDEIARRQQGESGAPLKIPKRLRGTVELVQRLQRRNASCPYTELLRYYCPVQETGPPKPCLTDHATPASAVSAFCRAVLTRLIPNEFLGVGPDGMANRQILMRHVDRFVRLRRYESLSLHEVCTGLKVTCIPWLEPPQTRPPSSDARRPKLALSDLQKRTELLQELVYYIFDSLLIPLIRAHFYVTESQIHRNRVFYFRHDVWRRRTERPLAELQASVFEEIPRDRAHRILARRSLGYSPLRLLPKASGARPIVNLGRRTLRKSGPTKPPSLAPSINSLVTPIFNVLNYERARRPELLGSALLSVGEIHPRLQAAKAKLLLRPAEPLFFVRLDIRSCFDTIPQHQVVRLIEDLVREDAYRITRHVEIRPTDVRPPDAQPARPLRKFFGRAAPVVADPGGPPEEPVSSGATRGRTNAVLVDLAGHREHDREDLLDLLEEHVRHNLVRMGGKYFRQRNGIPQGSVLSSLLCNLFYAAMEREVLGFLDCDEAVLLRLVDDFLLITRSTA